MSVQRYCQAQKKATCVAFFETWGALFRPWLAARGWCSYCICDHTGLGGNLIVTVGYGARPDDGPRADDAPHQCHPLDLVFFDGSQRPVFIEREDRDRASASRYDRPDQPLATIQSNPHLVTRADVGCMRPDDVLARLDSWS